MKASLGKDSLELPGHELTNGHPGMIGSPRADSPTTTTETSLRVFERLASVSDEAGAWGRSRPTWTRLSGVSNRRTATADRPSGAFDATRGLPPP